MQPADIIEVISHRLSGVNPKNSWGETSLFYNPERRLPHGVYFCTIKEKDGENDRSSELSRPGIYRLSIGLSSASYEKSFGRKPGRPSKGGTVDTGNDFREPGVLMPHPVYAWMSWVCILSPTRAQFEDLYPLIVEAHGVAVRKFEKKVGA